MMILPQKNRGRFLVPESGHDEKTNQYAEIHCFIETLPNGFALVFPDSASRNNRDSPADILRRPRQSDADPSTFLRRFPLSCTAGVCPLLCGTFENRASIT